MECSSIKNTADWAHIDLSNSMNATKSMPVYVSSVLLNIVTKSTKTGYAPHMTNKPGQTLLNTARCIPAQKAGFLGFSAGAVKQDPDDGSACKDAVEDLLNEFGSAIQGCAAAAAAGEMSWKGEKLQVVKNLAEIVHIG